MIGLIFSWFQEIRAELRLICYCPQIATDLYFPPEKEKRKEVRKSSAACEEPCEELPKLCLFSLPKSQEKGTSFTAHFTNLSKVIQR